MAQFNITSKTYGTHTVLLDDADYERVKALGGRWCLSMKRGKLYVQKRINGRIMELQRFIMQPPADEYVDHLSDTLDNRRSHLRICSNGANLRRGRLRPNNTSGYRGVSWDNSRGKWSAAIKVNFERISLGRYNSLAEAIGARYGAELLFFDV